MKWIHHEIMGDVADVLVDTKCHLSWGIFPLKHSICHGRQKATAVEKSQSHNWPDFCAVVVCQACRP